MMENKEYFNQRIDCDVNHCKYHDHTDDRCTLGKIKIGFNNKKGSICESFEK